MDFRNNQVTTHLKKTIKKQLTSELSMAVAGKNNFRRRREYNERMKELNHDLL